VIATIGVAAFLHLTKTQVVQVRLQSHSTKAFYAAEAGLEKGIKLLKDDFYYTPEEMEPSWADDKVYSEDGYIHLQTQKYMNPKNPHYDDEFYPLVAETDYNLEGNGGCKSTYKIDLSNLLGWTDRIWVKTTGRYYKRDGDGSYALDAERRILVLLRARDISPWDNAIFAGEGQNGRVINGNVDIRGSVHLLGTSLLPSDIAMEFSGSGNVKNNYAGMPPELAARVPSIAKNYGGDIMDSVEAEVRVQRGKVGLSGSSRVGEPDVPENGLKERVEGVYITDGYTGNQGDLNVYSDNGKKHPYDLDEFSLAFPRLSEPYKTYPTYLDYLEAKALVISDPTRLSQLQNIDPSSVFSYSSENGEIGMDANGILTIRGIVVVTGDVNFYKLYEKKKIIDDTIEYRGKGLLCSTTNVGINCSLITSSMSTYPTVDILGVMARDSNVFNSAQLKAMGVFYAENQIVSQKQTSVAGTFFSGYFDMGQNVPAIYQVPEVIRNLPDGMIGDFRVWSIQTMTWAEIGPAGSVEPVEE